MTSFTRYIPSMFQRRLVLFVGGMVVLAVLPAVQLVRVSILHGAQSRADAERRLISQQWIDTVRGEIRDRRGRVIAIDRPAMDIAVDYQVISGEWADTQAARKARRIAGSRWSQLSPEQRDQAIGLALPEFQQRLDAMWDLMARTANVSRESIDLRRAEIRQQVEVLATTITERQRLLRQREINRTADLPFDDDSAAEPANPVRTADVRRPIREQTQAHVIVENVPDTVGFEFQRLEKAVIMGSDQIGAPESGPSRPQPLMPGLRVMDAKRREYPLTAMDVPVDRDSFPAPLRTDSANAPTTIRVEGIATHTLGWMRTKLFREDVERRPMFNAKGVLDRGHYRLGDSVGQGGIEQAAEDRLRGDRGLSTAHLDTGDTIIEDSRAGANVEISIDIMLQARIQALFDPSLGLTVVQPWHKAKHLEDQPSKFKELPRGTPLNGAVVVLDIASGEILSMVSVPSFTQHQLKHDAEALFKDDYALAYLNRCIDKPYPPGSIVKPLVLAAAVTDSKYRTSETIACTGHFFPDKPLLYRCWIYKQFHDTHSARLGHDLTGSDAVKVSCNIFFFELGRRLGPTGIFNWFTRLGVGANAEKWNLFGITGDESTSLDPSTASLLHENAGSVPLPTAAQSSDAVLMGIGQGPLLWTPLHAADAFATLARGGTRLIPRLRLDAPQRRAELNFDPAGVAQALEGLHRGCTEPDGTSYSVSYDLIDGKRVKERVFNIPGIDVWAKTGTADAPPFVADLAFNGAHEAFDGDHAWCVFLCGINDKPKYAVAVVVDHGGSGGRVAGPVGNQVIAALVAEGYLPDMRNILPLNIELGSHSEP